MSKRWAALPRGIRWLAGGIVAVALALVVAWVLFVPAADWLARHDVGSTGWSLHETALDNARGRLLTLGAGLFAAGALVFTARNFTVSRRTLELTEQGQVTDRYTKAIEQLGSDKLDVRIGGIYALERVARDSARDHPTVMEVLTAFIREHSHEPWPSPDPGGREQQRSTRPDVQAALTVIGRRNTELDIQQIDLARAFLPGANLSFAKLAGADLREANLDGANLSFAKLAGADLREANLDGANLTLAELMRADLRGANLVGAELVSVSASAADLGIIDVRTNLRDADLRGLDLGRADLTDARLDGAVLTDARWPITVPGPQGWKRDTDSGRLKREDTRL